MTQEKLKVALQIALQAAMDVGNELKPFYGNIETINKGSGDSVDGVVTKLDYRTEQALEKKLSKFSANIGFRGEEFGVQNYADTTWLVDPIDGTAHFIRGLPFCTTMIALVKDGTVVLSVINDFVNDRIYWATRGNGSYCNGKKISVSQRSLKQSIISFETKLDKPEHLKKYLTARAKTGIIATVNCGFEFAMIASGKLDGRIGLDPYGKDWDFAAGSLLVEEAGGIATNIGKDTYDYKNHDFIITNAVVHKELTEGNNAIFPVLNHGARERT